MKFTIFVFGVVLLATHQYSFGQQNAAVIDHLIQELKKVSELEAANARYFGSITNAVSGAMNDVLDKTGVSNVINSVMIPIPINLNNTSVGNLLNTASSSLSMAAERLATLTSMLDQFFNAVLGTTDYLSYIFNNNPLCKASDIGVQSNFSESVLENFKLCLNNLGHTMKNHTSTILALQSELNTALQSGRLRVTLMSDIKKEMREIMSDIGEFREALFKCGFSQLFRIFWEVNGILFSVPSKCISFIAKRLLGWK